MPPTHIDSKSIFKRLKIWVCMHLWQFFFWHIKSFRKQTRSIRYFCEQIFTMHPIWCVWKLKCYISQRYIIRRAAFNSTAASCNKSHIYLILLFQKKTNEQSLPFQLMEWRNVIRCNQFSSSAHLAFSLSFKMCFHLMFGYSVLYIFALIRGGDKLVQRTFCVQYFVRPLWESKCLIMWGKWLEKQEIHWKHI